MNNKVKVIAVNFALIILFATIGSISYAQTEGFNVKTPIQKISDATSDFLKNIIEDSNESPNKSIPQDLVCKAECFLVIPEVEIIQSRGDFTGTGLMSCSAPNSDKFTEPLFYQINNLEIFEEGGGGLVVLVMDKQGMKAVLENDVHIDSDNSSVGPIGDSSEKDTKSFTAYAKPKNQDLEGYNLSGSLITYSSRDTFNAYQGTIVPIEILISPQDVPPALRDFGSLLVEWTKSCK